MNIYRKMFEESLKEACIDLGKKSTQCGDYFGKFHYHVFYEPGERLKQHLCLFDRYF